MFNIWLTIRWPKKVQIVKSTTSLHVVATPRTDRFPDRDIQDLVRRVPSPTTCSNTRSGIRSTVPVHHSPQFVQDWIRWGAGPRASQYLILGAKTRALLSGRHTPDIDDVRALAGPTLRHRLVTNFNAEADGVTAIEIVERLVRELS
jgi:MoxR-like ATPase